MWISAAWPEMICAFAAAEAPAAAATPPDAGNVITLVMPLTRTTGKCSLSGFTATSARNCGMNSPSSPVSTVSRTEPIFGQPQLGARIDHARIHAQALGFDHADALRRHELGADLGDLAVLDQHARRPSSARP